MTIPGRIITGTILGVWLAWAAGNQKAIALDEEDLLLFLSEPIDIELLESGELPADGSIVTENTISQSGLTIPSLWWAQRQFGGKLLTGWLAYTGQDGSPRRVDLVINQPVWRAISYVDRYAFINHFGLTSQDFGYDIRVFTRDQELLGAYFCDQAPVLSELDCQIFLQSTGQGALEGGRSNPFAAPSTDGGRTP